MTPELTVAILVAALAASTLGGVLGFGSGAIMLPILTAVFGVRVAVPSMAIAMTMTNAGRAAFSWKDIDWRAVFALSAAGIPMGFVGAMLFVNLDTRVLDVFIAVSLILLIPIRRLAERAKLRARLRDLPIVAAVAGIVSGMGGVTGPLATPFLLSYGLVRSSFLGTDGLYSTLVHATKIGVFASNGAMVPQVLVLGLGVGAVMFLGSFLGRRIVDKLDASRYVLIVELFLVVFALHMAFRAVQALVS